MDSFLQNEAGFDANCKARILSEDTYHFITDFPIAGFRRLLGESFCYADIENLYNVIYVDKRLLKELDVDNFQYQSIPKVYGLMQLEGGSVVQGDALVASGITQVQRPPLGLTGNGCILCFIDTGIDYTLDIFRRENGESRILAIWDQTIQTGTAPKGFAYGSEYTREQINQALLQDNPYETVPSRDENGHGTQMACVAAGNGQNGGKRYIGAAPDAELVVVKLRQCKQYLRDYNLIPEEVPAYQEDDIMLAVQYADSFAGLLSKPVVICLGIGSNSGDHAGSSALSRYLNDVAIRRSRAVVVAGGNEGNAGHHYRGDLREKDGIDAVEVRVSAGMQGFTLECWSSLPDTLQVGIRSPGGETIPGIYVNTGQQFTYRLIYSDTVIRLDSALVEAASGEQLIRFFIRDPAPGVWTFQVSATSMIYNGVFDMWLPIQQFLAREVTFLRPDPTITLTEPAMASEVIAVTDYDAAGMGFAPDSGRGFSRVGGVRPDLSAPGINVLTVRGVYSGSGLAAAITAGAVAQLLQWAVVQKRDFYAETRELKSYLIRGATRSMQLNYPNREWGYGRLNLEGVFDALT